MCVNRFWFYDAREEVALLHIQPAFINVQGMNRCARVCVCLMFCVEFLCAFLVYYVQIVVLRWKKFSHTNTPAGGLIVPSSVCRSSSADTTLIPFHTDLYIMLDNKNE